MRFAVMAAGGVGGYFGGRLAAAGHEVHFIARGGHLQALRTNGLTLESPVGDLHLPDISVTDDPAAIGPVDCVLFAVKLWDTETAAALCRPLLGPDTFVVPLQNGVESIERVAGVLGAERVLGGIAYIPAVIDRPGVIRHGGKFAGIAFGEADNRQSDRAQALLAACGDGGFDARIPDDIHVALWEKFVLLVAMSSWTAVTRGPIGPLREDADIRPMIAATLAETAAVGRARGIALPADMADRQLKVIDNVPFDMKASMLHDLERGNRLELPWLAGAVARMGAAAGVATPVIATLYGALKPFADGAPAAG
ncbi:MAG: 2-dehydropantoate 2-reductase [Hyphomicrobiales bacterium]|nr:2-dehydropantoate 2-reductase [Hyphomicrobiales bacterium]